MGQEIIKTVSIINNISNENVFFILFTAASTIFAA